MKNKNRQRRQYIACFYRKNRFCFFAAVLAALLMAGLNLSLAWLLQQVIDTAAGLPGGQGLGTLGLLLAGVVGMLLVIKGMQYFSLPRFLQRAMEQYKEYAFERLTQKSLASFRRESAARYLSAFSNDAATIEKGYLENQLDMLEGLGSFFGGLAMMLAYSPAMTAISCAFFLLPMGAALAAGSRAEQAERQVSAQNSAFVATLQDSLGGFSVMKSFRAEGAMAALFSRSSRAAEDAKCRRRRLLVKVGTLASAAGVTAQLGTFVAGTGLALAGWGVTPGVLLAFIQLTGAVIEPVQKFPQQFAARKAALALIDRLAGDLEEPDREEGTAFEGPLCRGITLRDVSFGYGPEQPVLRHVTAFLQAGRSYALVGPSGSGKSTLLELLLANHVPDEGEIFYDQREIRTISAHSLCDLVSVVQQNVFLFNASVRDNITMFRPFPRQEVDRAMALSGLTDLVAQRGEEYGCGDNGSGLSGGEKQRVSIARSLLKRAQVLLVDEATAALDPVTASQVAGAILDLEGVTRVVVTHRLDAAQLRRYDGILALKNGQIQEQGRFDELMERKGYFYSLYTLAQ